MHKSTNDAQIKKLSMYAKRCNSYQTKKAFNYPIRYFCEKFEE